MKKWWRAETGIFLATWLFLLLTGRSSLLNDPGTLWNTVTGRLLLHGQLPDHDPFSFTFAGHPWVPQGTFGGGVLAVLDAIGELDSILMFTAALLAAIPTWAAQRLIRAGFHWSLGVALVVLFFLGSWYHLHARPHLATMALLAWTFVQLADYDAGRISFARLTLLVPVMVLWINLHTGALGGIATAALAVAGWGLAWRLGWPGPVTGWRQLFLLVALAAACGLTIFINPYGWWLPASCLELLRSPVIPQYVDEHKPLNVFDPGQRWVLVLGLLYVCALLNTDWRQLRVSWLLPLVWLVLALKSIRHGPLFTITAVFGLVEVLPHTRAMQTLAGLGSWLYQPPGKEAAPRSWRPWAIPVALLLTCFGLQAAGVSCPVVGRGWAQLDPNLLPVALLDELRKQEHDHPGAPVLNDMFFGGFLIYYTPKLRVFIDDRCELYGDERIREYAEEFTETGTHDPARIARWIRENNIRLALVEKHKPGEPGRAGLDRYLANSAEWERLAETESAVLYQRRKP